MTTPRAASSAVFRRPLLGVVAPVIYLTALATVIAAATGGSKPPALSASLAAVHTTTHAVTVRHPAHTQHPAATTSQKSTVRSARARPVARIAGPARTLAPVVSRSADRVPPTPTPPAALVIRIASVATPATMQAAINECSGPVEIIWNDGWGFHPTEIAEHDYCGGTAFRSLSGGQRVRVIGGNLSGTYVANGARRFVPLGSSPEELDGIGDIALQTCVPGGLILVGLDRVG